LASEVTHTFGRAAPWSSSAEYTIGKGENWLACPARPLAVMRICGPQIGAQPTKVGTEQKPPHITIRDGPRLPSEPLRRPTIPDTHVSD